MLRLAMTLLMLLSTLTHSVFGAHAFHADCVAHIAGCTGHESSHSEDNHASDDHSTNCQEFQGHHSESHDDHQDGSQDDHASIRHQNDANHNHDTPSPDDNGPFTPCEGDCLAFVAASQSQQLDIVLDPSVEFAVAPPFHASAGAAYLTLLEVRSRSTSAWSGKVRAHIWKQSWLL